MANRFTLFTLAIAALVILSTAGPAACAPAAPAGEGEAAPSPTPTIWIIDDTSPSELATAMAAPSATALPDDFVWPTEAPYVPPLTIEDVGATLAADIATAQAQQPAGAASGAADTDVPTLTPTPTPVPLTEQVTQFARNMQGSYDIIARVRAGDSRHVKVSRSVAWPPNQEPVFSNWDGLMRTPITVVTTYYGDLPADYELISPPHSLYPNFYLDSGAEYVIFIWKNFVKASDYPDAPYDRFLYNQAQLDAIGGEGGGHLGLQAWIVDGSVAWRIPGEHIRSRQPAADLATARAAGESLPLLELETAIRAGLPQ